MIKLFIGFACMLLSIFNASAQLTGQSSMLSGQGNFSQYLNKTIVKNATAAKQSAMITVFNNEDNTIGSRFLFNEWVEGDSIINAQGVLINTVGFVFNYDKITGGLLATQDKINNMLVASTGIQSFILNKTGKKFLFQHLKTIDSSHFFLALIKSSDKYSLYKRFETHYAPANARNDGVMQTGNDYNEYKDDNEYYVVDETANAASKLSFKSKNIKEVLAAQKDKVNDYFKQHRDDEINEKFLVGLVTYLNQ